MGKRGRPKQSVGRCLFNRLEKYREIVLAFAFAKTLPLTNNQAERDSLRCVKIKLKAAGAFRTTTGAHRYVRIQPVISMFRKQSLNAFSQLQRLFLHQSISLVYVGSVVRATGRDCVAHGERRG